MEKITNIKLEDLKEYFSGYAYYHLKKSNINTLEDLLDIENNRTIIFNNVNGTVYNEIKGTVSLLRCKYLEEDPHIDINSYEVIKWSPEIDYPDKNNLLIKMGLSSKAYEKIVNRILRNNEDNEITVKDFFKQTKEDDFIDKISDIYGTNKVTKELYLKCKILTDYYDNKKNKEKANSLESLGEELKLLREERNPIKNNKYDLSNIKIDDLTDYFDGRTIKYIKKYNIENLEELINEWNKKDEFRIRMTSRVIWNQLSAGISLLKCKYLNEDPKINIYSKDPFNYEELLNLGLPFKFHALKKVEEMLSNLTISEFYEKTRSKDFAYELIHDCGLTEKMATEIIYKTRILRDYYDSKNNKENTNTKVEENNARDKNKHSWSNIKVEDLTDYLNSKIIDYIKSNSIENLEELINEWDKADKFRIKTATRDIYKELSGNISLLKCKYLNENPKIDINSENLITTDDFNNIGIPHYVSTKLNETFGKLSIRDFFELTKKNEFIRELTYECSLTNERATEIINKIKVITDFYFGKSSVEEIETLDSIIEEPINPVEQRNDDDSFESIREELISLKEQRKEIDRKIDLLYLKMQALLSKKVEEETKTMHLN